MNLVKINLLLYIFICCISCTPLRSFTGQFQYRSPYSSIKLTFHEDKSFVQNGKVEMCFEFNIFGKYERKGNYLNLKSASQNIEVSQQNSFLTTSYDDHSEGLKVYVYFNGLPIDDSVKVVFDEKITSYTSNSGLIQLKEIGKLSRIRVSSLFGGKPYEFAINTIDAYNKIYISIVDNSGWPCYRSHFFPKLKIKGDKLVIPQKSNSPQSSRKGNIVFLRAK